MSKKDTPTTLCGWSDSAVAGDLDALKKLVDAPRYVCRRCTRAANKKKWLCKPQKLPKD